MPKASAKHKLIQVQPKEDPYRHRPAQRRGQYTSKQDAVLPRKGSDEDEDQFASLYANSGLLEPPYAFPDLWLTYEQCDVLWACIDAVVTNCERQHEFEFAGDDTQERDTGEAKAQWIMLRDFFSRVNEHDSWLALRKKLRRDVEVTGNAFVEIIRNKAGQVERLYYLPSTYVRVTRLDDQETPITEQIPRNGKIITIQTAKKFRRFARLVGASKTKLVWFKEFGDPRTLDATTGRYTNKPKERATEIWWFRQTFAGNTYGIPRWVSAITDVKGRYLARWKNYDGLEQGIPPFLILLKGGKLTEGTRRHISKILEEWRDPACFNEPAIVQIEPELYNLDLNTGSSKAGTNAEVIKMRDDRTEEYMFAGYLKHTEDAIRKVYRLPPIFIGSSSDYTYATSYASLEVAETQVFDPIRKEFDEKVNVEFLQNEFGVRLWRFKTRGAQIGDKETFYKSAGMWARTGGPSLNHLIQLGNEAFGTDWSPYEGALYNKIPLAVLMALVRDGRVTVDDAGDLQVVPPEQIQQTTQKDDHGEIANDSPMPTVDMSSAGDDAKTLIDVLTRIEDRGHNYEPPEIDETDYTL
ncbi:MAG: hypothetical protein HY913_04535 [Desulfomonile tiedjei]|nr:hypothetical protein [Desulfomonile tiedjei]